MKAYKLNGELVSQISQHKSDIVLYSYLSKNKHVKSGVTVVAGYKEKVDNFYDWQFEVDLDKFEITNRIAPSY
ncbi:hypothetical protein [Hafnia sp. CBA7124]|uniref:hypothetical protein n=1 Tax=Hafnia sp. CBA7124 TaxID=1848580 RepID=UPI000BBB3FEE|nr:hypothetical protein [Hafnia sp. CBA7124]